MSPKKDVKGASPGSYTSNLTRDPSWSLVKLMTTPIGELNFARSPGSGPAGSSRNLEEDVEELIATAEKRARDTGQSVERVLMEMGVLPAEEGPGSDAEKGRLAETLQWEVRGTASPSAAQPRRGAAVSQQALERAVSLLLTRHPGATPEDLTRFVEECLADDSENQARLTSLGLVAGGRIVDLERFAKQAPYLEGFPATAGPWKELFEQMLVDSAFSFKEFQDAVSTAHTTGSPFIEVLLEREHVTPEELARRMGEAFGIAVWDKGAPTVGAAALERFSLELVERHGMVPLEVIEDTMRVGCASPPGPSVVAAASRSVGMAVEPLLLLGNSHRTLLEEALSDLREIKEQSEIAAAAVIPVREILTKASSVKIVQEIFEEAIEAGATDIHLDPQEGGMHVRFRVDSMLFERMVISHEQVGREAVSRIKVLADLDTTERRRPQDGHIRAAIGGRDYDMRIATVPTNRGERMAIRIADPTQSITDINTLGIPERDLGVLLRLIERPYGMVLSAGPVGSGKTTTLYSCLRRIGGTSKNIMTIEDPVENEIPMANQISVNYRIGFDFVRGLRAILRHDPDVILVGEIRDEETARIAVRASLTGLLVFSTLHANTAAGAVTALLNFGIPPYLLGNSLLGVVAQRLVRKICPECATSYRIGGPEASFLGVEKGEVEVKRGRGCARCLGSGYHGRTGVFEMLEVTPDIRDLVLQRASEVEIARKALEQGMVPLRSGGLEKVTAGITTVAEVSRVLDI